MTFSSDYHQKATLIFLHRCFVKQIVIKHIRNQFRACKELILHALNSSSFVTCLIRCVSMNYAPPLT